MRSPLTMLAPSISEVFDSCGFTATGLVEYLGTDVMAAARRGEPEAVRCALAGRDDEPLATLVSAFLLHDETPLSSLRAVFGSELCDALLEHGVVGRRSWFWADDAEHGASLGESQNVSVTALIDIQPHIIAGKSFLVFSDVDASMLPDYVPGPDHVLGVGAASVSLLNITPTSCAGSVLDIGTGSGVQALGQLDKATSITATDIHPRALDLAEATFAAAGALDRVELLSGAWCEPVSGRLFDRIVANPPFVVGPPVISHVYRDSGLDLDGATQRVISDAIAHLQPGGTAHILGAWVHTVDESWRQRVAQWFPEFGVAAWIVERDRVDPARYVGTWLRDESIDPRSVAGRDKTRAWLQHFSDAGVTEVGFGYIAVKLFDDATVVDGSVVSAGASEILAEELPHLYNGNLGDESLAYFDRIDWLRNRDVAEILDSQFMVSNDVAKEEVFTHDAALGMGFAQHVIRLTRMTGPCWSHEIDAHIAAIVAGLHPDGLSLGEVAQLFAVSKGLDPDSVVLDIVAVVIDLVRHGFLIPTDAASAL
ncbi:MAG: class I SAM-dependent methyltransferase [Corynebacterium sp.]|uniref:class I SAM-dependent methyltransferase n=1 Tax=Corynebacterium sp. TaxID=1720 RepID=UPI0026DADFD7|nr:class I SAM-dependent methyltransferase [Corynebacterium sp.]MDO5099147.1 class I SAM-dependent methyltransferase [Corynebacterium sp.]